MSEFRFSLHLLNRSSHPLPKAISNAITDDCRVDIPDQTAFVLVVDKVESIARPGLLDLPDVLLESHLQKASAKKAHIDLIATHLSLRLDDNLLDEGFVLPQVHVIDMSQGHPSPAVSCHSRAK